MAGRTCAWLVESNHVYRIPVCNCSLGPTRCISDESCNTRTPSPTDSFSCPPTPPHPRFTTQTLDSGYLSWRYVILIILRFGPAPFASRRDRSLTKCLDADGRRGCCLAGRIYSSRGWRRGRECEGGKGCGGLGEPRDATTPSLAVVCSLSLRGGYRWQSLRV